MKQSDMVICSMLLASTFLVSSVVSSAPYGLSNVSQPKTSDKRTSNAVTQSIQALDYGTPLVENGIEKLGVDWSPDGNWIAYEQAGEILVIPANGGSAIAVTNDIDGYCYLPRFTADSNAISFTCFDAFYGSFSIIQVFFKTNGYPFETVLDDALAHTYSDDGAIIVYRVGTTSELALYNTINHNTRILAEGDYNSFLDIGYGSSAISPDGNTVVTSMVMNDGTMKLFSIPISGGVPVQLTDGVFESHNYPDFSPDGKWILFTDLYFGDLLAYDTDTGDWFDVFPETDYLNTFGRFSPDGSKFVYLHNILTGTSVYEVYVAPFTLGNDPIRSLTLTAPSSGDVLTGGTYYAIEWDASDITSVIIEYSINDGATWNIIATNVPAIDETYGWTVPELDSDTCIIRISSQAGDISDLSDIFSIALPSEPSATLYSPGQGESLYSGNNYHIQWDASDIDTINLEYQTVRGGTWNTIATYLPATDYGYDWSVPYLDSGTCMMRITTFDGVVLDVMSGTFSISSTGAPELELLTPAGGESWSAGSQHDIIWQTNLDTVTIWYSVNGQASWNLIVENYSPTSTTGSQMKYTWSVPNAPSTDCYIRITDENDTDVADTNILPFTITGTTFNPELIFRHNTGYPIYTSSPAIDSEGIIYIANRLNGVYAVNPNGTRKWTTFFDDFSMTDLQEIWASPVLQNGTVYIASGNGYLYALNTSDGSIKWRYNAESPIYGPPAVSFDGNIFFGTADGRLVGLKSDSTKLFTPKETGVPYFTSPSIGIDGTVYLTGLDGTVYAYGQNGNLKWKFATGLDRILSSPVIDSDGTIYVATSGAQSTGTPNGYLYAITPDGSYKWDAFIGTTIVSSPAIGNDGTIYLGSQYYNSSSVTFSGYITAVDPADGTVRWDVPYDFDIESSPLVTSDGTIYVGTTKVTTSDLYTGSLYALSPTDGSIQWQYDTNGAVASSPSIGPDGEIYFGSADGNLYAVQGPTGVTLASSGWPKYRQNLGNTGRVSGSAITFVRVASPNGNENYIPGSSMVITWTYRNVDTVLIEFSADNGDTYTTIDQVSASDVSYTWQIPGTINSSNCLIRISDTQNSSITDVSNATFKISQLAFIEVLAPGGGESFKIGSSQTIQWNSNSVTTVTLAYSADGGENWIQIATAVNASTGQYEWTIPNNPSTNCRLRISDSSNGTVNDISSGAFSIESSSFIQVTAPKFGDTWIANSSRDIKWEFNGPVNIKLEYSVDNGLTWQTIEANIPALTGSYTWTVPDTEKPNCFIRITDTANALTTAMSARFEIAKPDLSISHIPITDAAENEPLTFTAQVTSTSDISQVKLLYDVTGDRQFITNAIDMELVEGQTYRVTLSEGTFTAQGIEYYIWAKDASNRTTRSPDNMYYSITATISDMKSAQTLTGGSAANAYRMVSIPLDLQSEALSQQLKNALPSGEQGTDWRIFWFDPAQEEYLEYVPDQSDLSGFEPGKAFWLISKNDFRLTAPQGATVSTDGSFSITLKAGWNDIANPWMFDISWDDIENPSGADLSVLYEYNGSWSNPLTPPTELEPWKGYAVKNNTNMNVVIKLQPNPAGANRIAEALQAFEKRASTDATNQEWMLNLAATVGEASDTANYIGVRSGASVGKDAFDHPEPPPVGEYISLTFPRIENNAQVDRYTVDMRPPAENTLNWECDITTTISEQEVTVTLNGLDTLPHGLGIAVQDRDNGDLIPVHDGAFSFLSDDGLTERHFLLTVGSDDDLSQNGLTVQPVEFLTATNYPNPFNPSTTIRYALPESSRTFITIFNVLGQQIERFDMGVREAGVHELYYDASKHTSGIYFYRVSTNGATVTGKMLFMK